MPDKTRAQAKRPAINTRATHFGQSANLSIPRKELPDATQCQGLGVVGQAKAHSLLPKRNTAGAAAFPSIFLAEAEARYYAQLEEPAMAA